MTPHLHPRSRMTSGLFTGTLAVCFMVVSLPHLLPCPVQRPQYAENGEVMERIKRKRRNSQEANQQINGDVPQKDYTRPCPLPKPWTFFTRLFGDDSQVTANKPRATLTTFNSYGTRTTENPP